MHPLPDPRFSEFAFKKDLSSTPFVLRYRSMTRVLALRYLRANGHLERKLVSANLEELMTVNGPMDLLERQDCVLLLVDIQKSMLDLCAEPDRISRNAAALIEAGALFGIPVLFSVHNEPKLGGVLPELTGMVRGPRILDKMEFNCFENEAIRGAIGETGRKTLLLAGLEAHVCIFHTGLRALRMGYRVHVAADAVTSRSLLNKEIGLRRIETAGAVISSTEMMLFELLNRAGTPEFRAALPLIKRLQA